MKSLPGLRPDLVIQEQTINSQKAFICKDPVKQAYFRFDEEEYFVLALLDGKKTALDIAQAYNEEFRDDLTDGDIEEFVSSLKSKELFERTLAEQNTYLYEKLKEQRRSRILQAKGSMMYFRVQVWDPDKFFDRMIPYIHWIWSRRFVFIMNLFMLSGLIVLLINIKDVRIGMAHVLDFFEKDALSLFILWLTVMGTIMIHELGHGLTCKRFGGECHEIGFLFMFMNPCMYANVNDAWMFEKKSHRLYVTYAGCYVEMMLGFICVYIWLFTQPGSALNLFTFQIVVVAFFSAIFMNFNPLMKFDGYFALSDYLESPNLRNRSQSYVKYLTQKYIFRLDREHDEFLTNRERWILFIYGALVVGYLINVFSGLGFMFAGMLTKQFGIRIGLLLTILLLYKILGAYLKKLIGFIKVLMSEHKAVFKRKPVKLLGLLLLGGLSGVFVFVPFARHLEFEATLEPIQNIIIRSLASGYVENLNRPNQLSFSKGAEMARLNNIELDQQISNLQIDIRETQLLAHQALANEDTAQYLKLNKVKEKMATILKDLERQQKHLIIVAPFDGMLEKPLASVENTFVNTGQELGKYMNPDIYKATVDVIERDMQEIRVGTKAHLSLDVKPENFYWGEVTAIAETAKSKGLARLYEITVAFPNDKFSLRKGLNGSVMLYAGKATFLQSFWLWVQKTVRLDLQF